VGVPQSPENRLIFTPHRFLRGGHLQTLASFLIRRSFQLSAPEERFVEVAPGVRILCHCHWQKNRSEALTVIIVHGLEGSSDSHYARGIAEKALAAGMNAVRFNQRNCGGTEALAPVLYHSGLSNDVAVVAQELIERDRISRLALVGFSMGGNIILKLAGEWGGDAPRELRAVIACCPAIDLSASADALHAASNRIYERYFLWALRRRMRRKARLFPKDFDIGRLRGIKSLREFDDKVTAHYCGFTSVDDYYDRASAAHTIERIAVPTLIISASNDPFIRLTTKTRQKIARNSKINFVETRDGGHCAFIGRGSVANRTENGRRPSDFYWVENEIVTFLKRH
jgi:uncharacterized protein